MIDPIADEALARFVVGSHQRSTKEARAQAAAKALEDESAAAAAAADGGGGGGGGVGAGGLVNNHGEETIPQDLLQKYIQYARSNMRPQLHGLDEGKLAQLYADLRRESATSGGVPIAVRHIESVMRISEAHAKMHLRDHVRDDDLDVAIR